TLASSPAGKPPRALQTARTNPALLFDFPNFDSIEAFPTGIETKGMKGERRDWFLIVEDNEDEERLALRAVKRAEIEGRAVVAHDGEEALRILEEAASKLPAFVLLDIKLPKISGTEVLEWMRKRPQFA